ncbi:MAG: universal stress protein [Candidatus Methanosuratincola sp.]|jgi:nucleotide-binding universal stress UspA family protein
MRKTGTKIEKILFPTDFSPISSKAREHVIFLAKALNSFVYILHAIEPLQAADEELDEEISRFYSEIEREVGRKLEKEIEIFQSEGIGVQPTIVIGKRWAMINTFAKDYDVDLVVIGSHGFRAGDRAVALGTTSHKVAITCPSPVLIVRYEED